jgi:hypothetical protein
LTSLLGFEELPGRREAQKPACELLRGLLAEVPMIWQLALRLP